MNTTTQQILKDLEQTRENMLALSDDIWLSIDHNDPDALTEGVAFKQEYNKKMVEFDNLSSEISAMVQQYLGVDLDQTLEVPEQSEPDRNDRILKELNKEEPHDLSEDFTYKRPYGFVLCGQGFKNTNTWRKIFELVCKTLRQKDPDKFKALPENPKFRTRRGNSYFSTTPSQLRCPAPVGEQIFAEVNLSANHLRDVLVILLKEFDIDHSQVAFYLRQDRDAQSQ